MLELHVIKSREFVRVGAHGQIDWDQSRAGLAKLARLCVERKVDHAMLDVRDVYSDLNYEQLAALAWTFKDAGFKDHQRLAVLYHEDPEAQARLFVACAAERGWNVRAFDDFEEAVEWLAMTGDEGGPGAESKADGTERWREPPTTR